MPVIVDLAPLTVMAVATLVILILLAYRATIGALVSLLVSVLEKATIHVLGWNINLFQPGITALEGINNIMYFTLGKTLEANQWAWHKFVHWNAYVWDEVTGTNADTAVKTGQALHTLKRWSIPAAIAAALIPLKRLAHHAAQQALAAQHEAAQARTKPSQATVAKTAQVVKNYYPTKVVVEQAKGQAVATSHALDFPRIGTLEKNVEAARANIAKLRRSVVGAGAAALVAVAIGKLGFGWARCSKVGRLGKSICGMDEGLLESLLAGALLLASTISIVEFAKSCQAFTDAVESPLKDFVRELRDLNPLGGPDASSQLAAYIAGDF